MRNLYKAYLSLICLALISGISLASTPGEGESVSETSNIDPDAVNKLLENPNHVSSSEMIRERIDQYAKDNNFQFGIEDGRGRTYYQATETIAVDETNPQWAKWRVTAYKKAFLKIRQQFLEETFGRIAGEMISDYAIDESDNRLEFSDLSGLHATTKEKEIYDKLLGLTGAKLDRALEEYGIDPSEYDKAPPEQRRNLFKDNLIDTSIKKAGGSLTGLIPIKTFVGIDTEGNHTIGVIAMYYGKLKQLADDITKKRNPMLKKKGGKPIASYIPENTKILADTFGVRLAFNNEGRPVIISYGQWSFLYKGKNQKKIDRGYDMADKKAKTESQKQIAQFLKASASYKEIEQSNTRIEEDVVQSPEGNVSEQTISEMIDTLERSTVLTYKADLRGIKPAKHWSYKFDNGHQVVGVVSVWTQTNAEGTDNVRNWQSEYNSPEHRQPQKQQFPSQSEVREGAGMDVDF